MRTFVLRREEDVTGVSGTGVVADGVVFPNGKVVVGWRGSVASVVVYDAIADVEAIHGHDGRTVVEYT